MLDEELVREHMQDLAREAAHQHLLRVARCCHAGALPWTRPLRRRVGSWLVASGRHLMAGDE